MDEKLPTPPSLTDPAELAASMPPNSPDISQLPPPESVAGGLAEAQVANAEEASRPGRVAHAAAYLKNLVGNAIQAAPEVAKRVAAAAPDAAYRLEKAGVLDELADKAALLRGTKARGVARLALAGARHLAGVSEARQQGLDETGAHIYGFTRAATRRFGRATPQH